MDAVQLDLFAEDPTARPWLLSGIANGKKNECGVYTENVLEFREGNLTGPYVEVKLCADGDFILYEFSYMTKTYGCGHPLSIPSNECHRNNSAQFLADCIFDSFRFSYLNQDRNLDKEAVKALTKLCEKVCDRIAHEII